MSENVTIDPANCPKALHENGRWRIGTNISAMLDQTVHYANQFRIFRFHYKPYFLMSDAATVAALVYAWAFAKRFPSASSYGLDCSLLLALLAYKLCLKLRAAQGRPRARSFLQDSILFVIPTYLLASLFLREPISLSLTYMATIMPLYGCFARIGCFLGGCCYGKCSRVGVLYPKALFQPTFRQGCRNYAPGPDPGGRIFPIQLVEAYAQGLLFVFLTVRLWRIPHPTGTSFWLYLLLYGLVRFFLDFARVTSARPRYGRFSEAQCFCIAIQIVCICVLVHTGIDVL